VSTADRDEHFRGFAKQQFDDVDAMFNRLFIARDDCDQARETEATHDIQLFLARRAYDLACHVADELLGGSNPEYFISGIPDLIELSKEGETNHA